MLRIEMIEAARVRSESELSHRFLLPVEFRIDRRAIGWRWDRASQKMKRWYKAFAKTLCAIHIQPHYTHFVLERGYIHVTGVCTRTHTHARIIQVYTNAHVYRIFDIYVYA